MNGTADDGKDPLWSDLERVQEFYDKHELVKLDFKEFKLFLIAAGVVLVWAVGEAWAAFAGFALCYLATTKLEFSYIRRKKN